MNFLFTLTKKTNKSVLVLADRGFSISYWDGKIFVNLFRSVRSTTLFQLCLSPDTARSFVNQLLKYADIAENAKLQLIKDQNSEDRLY